VLPLAAKKSKKKITIGFSGGPQTALAQRFQCRP
jgi:hypothetical protein